MSTYIIGDVHGCFLSLQQLVEKLQFNPVSDELWFVGDLINRGPDSLEALRYVKSLGNNAIYVLGNHDLHFLAVYHQVRKRSGKDTLQQLIHAPDSNELVHWLRHQKFLHHDKSLNTVMVHAGIPPMWNLKTAKKQANKLAKKMRSDDYVELLHALFGNRPEHWHDADTPRRRRRFAANALTRMRYCWSDGSLDFTFNAQPAARPQGLYAWYNVPNRQPIEETIVFGHWAAHPAIAPPGIMPIDRGRVYGGSLVAYWVEEQRCVWVN